MKGRKFKKDELLSVRDLIDQEGFDKMSAENMLSNYRAKGKLKHLSNDKYGSIYQVIEDFQFD